VLGLPAERPPLLDLEPARVRFRQLTREYGLELDPSTPVWQLPVGDQQWLEILKLLFRNACILILDEPTAVLAPSQAQQLFRTVRRFAEEGRAIIFISHKLEEMKEVADRVTVLRDGHVVGTVDAQSATPSQLAQMMVGRSVFLDRRPRPAPRDRQAVLVVDRLSCLNDRGAPALREFSLTAYAGEILGIAGVDGNGQRELAECIAGLRQPTGGSIQILGQPVQGVVSDTRRLGYVPEDRRKTGLVLSMSVAENLLLKTCTSPPYTQRGVMQWATIRRQADELIREYDVRTPHAMLPVRYLSGGNQQKVVVARELSGQPVLLVTSQPTRGLDLGAVEAVHKVLLRERNRGCAVIFISTELPEVLALSDRIVVAFKGQIMGELDGEQADVNLIGEWMLGHRVASPAGGAR
jgi:simple sugar transport system ATP-binding protein